MDLLSTVNASLPTAIYGFPPTEVAAILAIAGVALTVIFWVLDATYIRKKHFHLFREKDKTEIQAAANTQASKWENWKTSVESRVTTFDKNHEVLVAGPIKELTDTLAAIKVSLEGFDQRAEVRHERLIQTLLSFEKRLTVVETKQSLGSVT